LFQIEIGGALMFEIGPMQLLSENKTNFSKLTRNFALIFQLWDDYYDLCLPQVMSELSV
jgi:geranylgeranyl pyrophosphate synthase